MDPQAFRDTLDELQTRDCHFQKVLFSGRFQCRHCERFCLAEREGMRCRNPEANSRCRQLLNQLQEKARFLLPQGGGSHAQRLRLQTGLLQALQQLARQQETDIPGLLDLAGNDLPWQAIIRQIAETPTRNRR